MSIALAFTENPAQPMQVMAPGDLAIAFGVDESGEFEHVHVNRPPCPELCLLYMPELVMNQRIHHGTRR